jgi:hypothetical protein
MHFRAVAAAVCPLRCLKTFHFIFQQGEVLSENRKDTHDPRLSPRDISACITDLFDVFLFLPTSFVLTYRLNMPNTKSLKKSKSGKIEG